jgi:thioredoxin-dependent peroxiredoxin
MIEVGELAPAFEGRDCEGRWVRLGDFHGRRVVLFFYPRAFTPGCVTENRAFRDNHERIRALGAELVGVSVDPRHTQCEFARKERLTFPLLADEDKAISRAYGVLWPVLGIDRRATFIIGPDAEVEAVIHHEVRVYRHLDDVLAHLQAKAPPGAGPGSPR